MDEKLDDLSLLKKKCILHARKCTLPTSRLWQEFYLTEAQGYRCEPASAILHPSVYFSKQLLILH